MMDRIARITMLIRRPAADVFEAFANPDRITRFWLERASGPLAKDAQVTWHFMVPDASTTVVVTAFEAPRRIAFDWADGIHVELRFDTCEPQITRVSVEVSG